MLFLSESECVAVIKYAFISESFDKILIFNVFLNNIRLNLSTLLSSLNNRQQTANKL